MDSESNIFRLSCATIGFHNGTLCSQLIITDENIAQSEVLSYDLANNATIYISVSNLQSSNTKTSYLWMCT
ncbi:hypothetical protein MUO69_06965 [Candidatus Bathyarchaeota archaeon]|nr:hypothetical protein [Candidatus Bathyarchaeota archaeon]